MQDMVTQALILVHTFVEEIILKKRLTESCLPILEGNHSIKEQRHFYAYIAISGFFYMHWTMYKESQGQEIGYLKPLWYHFAKEFSKKALPLYNE